MVSNGVCNREVPLYIHVHVQWEPPNKGHIRDNINSAVCPCYRGYPIIIYNIERVLLGNSSSIL